MDLIREVGKRTGRDVQIVDMGRRPDRGCAGRCKVDAVIAAMGYRCAERKVDFSAPYHFVQDAFLVGGNSNVTLNSAKRRGPRRRRRRPARFRKWIVDNLVGPDERRECLPL
jgi:hypothetical protein